MSSIFYDPFLKNALNIRYNPVVDNLPRHDPESRIVLLDLLESAKFFIRIGTYSIN